MIQIMPNESKLPSLFLNIKKNEAHMITESVKESLEQLVKNTESEIKNIKEQFVELQNFQFETLEDDYPFYVSPLAIMSLRTVSEFELKEILVCNKLSNDLLDVLKLFYFIHFDCADFEELNNKNQKQLVIEIVEYYSNNLRNIEKDQKFFRYLDFQEKYKLELYLKNHKNMFSVVSDMSIQPFLHSIIFFSFKVAK